MNKAEFISKWSKSTFPDVIFDISIAFTKDLETVIIQELIKKHVYVSNGSKPEICKDCQNQIKKSDAKTTKRYCPICNQFYIF